jgi:hypothetical protein
MKQRLWRLRGEAPLFITTTPNAYPIGDQWLSLRSHGFIRITRHRKLHPTPHGVEYEVWGKLHE